MTSIQDDAKNLRLCMVMLGAPFEEVVERLERMLRQFEQMCVTFCLLIDKMPTGCWRPDQFMIVDVSECANDTRFQGWPALEFPWKFTKYLSVMYRMAAWLSQIGPSIDIVYFSTGLPFVLPLILMARLLGKSVVIQVGGTAFYARTAGKSHPSLRDRAVGLVEQMCYRLSSLIAAENRFSARFLKLERYGVRVGFFGAFTYVDTKMFTIAKRYSDRSRIVGFVGRLTAGKGVLEFVDAAKRIHQTGESAVFRVVGGGPLSDKIRKLSGSDAANALIECVGPVSNAVLPVHLNEMRLLVHPSFSEGLPHVVLEAMSCGTPVLATLVGGLPEVLIDGRTGFVLADSAPEHIQTGIAKALNDPNLDQVIANARRFVEDEYSFPAIVRKHLSILSGLASREEQS